MIVAFTTDEVLRKFFDMEFSQTEHRKPDECARRLTTTWHPGDDEPASE
jgi:hypothetical protein